MSFPRHQILARLRELISRRIPIIGGGAGTGISAKFEEEGGIDLIVIYNRTIRMAGSYHWRMMPYGDNAIVRRWPMKC
jgi:predicted TIM-barrel enzyme